MIRIPQSDPASIRNVCRVMAIAITLVSTFTAQGQQPVAHWTFDDYDAASKTYIDISDHGYNAVTGSITTSAGITGLAADCSDTTDNITVPLSKGTLNYPQFTVEALIYCAINPVRPGSFDNYMVILNCTRTGLEGSGFTGGYGFQITDGGLLQLGISSPTMGSWNSCLSTTVLKAATWYHVAGTYDGATIRLYINGLPEGATAAPGGYLAQSEYPVCIGCQPQVIDPATKTTRFRDWFRGRIDELKVYDSALSGASIAAHAAVWGFGKEPQLLAHWSFDAVETGIFRDMTGHGFDAVSSGVGTIEGIAGKALNCTGTTFDCAVNNSNGVFSMGKFSVETWYCPTLDQHGDEIIFNYNKVTSGIRNGYDMHVTTDSRIDFNISTIDGSQWIEALSTTVVKAGVWYHLTGSYDGSALRLYVNGNLERTVPLVQTAIREPATSFRIGCTMRYENTIAFPAKGKIDEMKVYNYAVTADSVLAHYKSYDPPTTPVTLPKLLAHWSFDSTDNTSYFDVTGNGYTAKTSERTVIDGVRGKALDCNSETFEVRVPNSATDFEVPRFTIEGWIYSYIDLTNPGSFYNYKGIFNYVRCGLEGSKLAGGYSLQISDNGRPFTSMSTPAGDGWVACESDSILQPRKWYHLACTYDESKLRLYVNGTLAKVVDAPGGYFSPQKIPARIGAQFQVTDPATYAGRIRTRFNGKIDELKLYNYALDASALKASYESNKPPEVPSFEINLGMKTTHAQPGDTVIMPVYLANHEDYAISALQLGIGYDPAKLQLVSISKDSGLVKGWELFSWNAGSPGAVLLAMAGTEVKIGYGEGELFRCIFVVSRSVADRDTCRVKLDKVIIDEKNNLVNTTIQDGRIIISDQSICYGDVSGNGEVTVTDALQVLKYVVGAIALPDAVCCSNFTTTVADVSGNGAVTSYDAALIFQYSLGLLPAFPVETKKVLLSKQAALSGRVASLSIAVNNSTPDELVFDLIGSNLSGFYAGEFAITCDAPAELLSKSTISTRVRGATLSSRFAASENQLKVAVTSNDDVDDDNPVTLVRITLPPSAGQTAPKFSITRALINEGMITTEFTTGGLVGAAAPMAVSKATKGPAFRLVNTLLKMEGGTGNTLSTLTVWNLSGRLIARQTITGAVGSIDLHRFGRGAFLVRLQSGSVVTSSMVTMTGN